MKHIPIRLGPLALLLAVISICLTTLSILTFTTARADLSLAEKYADTVRTQYELEKQGQDFLREAKEFVASGRSVKTLPDTQTDEDGIVMKLIEIDHSSLRIGLEEEKTGELKVVCWSLEKEFTQDPAMHDLWSPGEP